MFGGEMVQSFPEYAFEIIADIILGIVLGVLVNMIVDYVSDYFKLPMFIKLLLQLFLIIVVLYILKIDSKYLYDSWKGSTNYGIVFTAVFLAVQKNMVKLFTNLYDDETHRLGVFKF